MRMTDRAEQMTLDDNLEVDSKATANNVRNFLTFKFEHFQNYAGLNVSDLSVVDDSHLSSPKMDASGVSSHGGKIILSQVLTASWKQNKHVKQFTKP